MTTEEKLSLFRELINCAYPLYHWDLDASLNLVSTNWQKDLFSGDFFSYMGFRERIRQFLGDGKRTPVIIEAESNLLWIAGFAFDDMRLVGCHLIGPILGGRDTPMVIRKKLDSFELTAKLRATIFKIFEEIPVIPINILNQYAVMLHYCLNREKLSLRDVACLNTAHSASPAVHMENPRHGGIWLAEQTLCKMLEEGDPRYREALEQSFSLSDGVKADSGDSLRNKKNNCIVLLTLCSRSCIKGGLPPAIAYDLNDYYAQKFEACTSITQLTALTSEMLEDYVGRVQDMRNNSSVSGPILSSCEYIRTHITKPLSIGELADRTGYSEYYFSHKFKKEMGCSVNDYILKEKLEQAKLLLAGTADSIQSISDSLAFGNRSYFYSCFQKHVGVSPSEYRKQNGKL